MTAEPMDDRRVSVDVARAIADQTIMTIWRGQKIRYVGPPLPAWHIGRASGALRATGRTTRAAQRGINYIRAGYCVLFVGPTYEHAKWLRIAFYDLAEEQGVRFAIERTKIGTSSDRLAEAIVGMDSRRWRIVFDHTADIGEHVRDLLLARPEFVDCSGVPQAAVEKYDGYMLPTLGLVLMDGEVEWSSPFARFRAFARRWWWSISARWRDR